MRASERTRHDPWLLASDIATATLADAKQPNVTIARRALEAGKLDPFDASELASAVGTLALHDGKITPGRKLLRQSLVDPTDNAVAQAEWANAVVKGIPIDPSAYALRLSYEARTQNAARQQQWADALLHCRNWCLDEPFSALPAIVGSYYAAVALGDHKSSEAFARQGLLSNPAHAVLLNNLAAALAGQDRVAEAVEELSRISAAGRTEHEATVLATEGLIAMRKGEVDVGRQKYLQAIELARRKDTRIAFLALLHLAREEFRHSTERGAAIIREVKPTEAPEPASESLLVSLKSAAERPSDKELLDRLLDDAHLS